MEFLKSKDYKDIVLVIDSSLWDYAEQERCELIGTVYTDEDYLEDMNKKLVACYNRVNFKH